MRFAYMDSQGNEVTIPSVDALALRIQLGAISADTELYDAQADRWGPAHTHDIFHTLSRDAEEEGLVAPPPAMAPELPVSESASADDAESEPEREKALESVAEAPEADADLDDLDLSFVVTSEVEPGGDESADAGDMDLGGMGLDLVPGAESESESVSAELGGGLDAPMELSDDEMELESPMDFVGGGDTGSSDGGLDLEQPLSDHTPETPPERQQQDQDDGERKPRSRPSAPRRPKKVPVGMIVGVVVLLGGGAAAFLAWRSFAGTEVETPALPPVVIPDIPAELLARMGDMAEAALTEMVEDLRGRLAALDIPTQPRDAWLGGNYLANASQFEDIETFWIGIERFVDEVRDTDTQLFHDKYVQQVEAAGFTADTAAMLIERADSGFVAARDARFEAYSLIDDLLNASLDLHTFLLDNEQNIAYEPASAGVSDDPVLEAVPSTEMLGDQMWDRIEGITDALSELGTLDRVTRERLFAVLFDRIRRAGIQ